jgi:hypothetical protein
MDKMNQIEAMLKVDTTSLNQIKLKPKASASINSMKKSTSNHRIFYSSFDKQHTVNDILTTNNSQQNKFVKEFSDLPLTKRDYLTHSQVKLTH